MRRRRSRSAVARTLRAGGDVTIVATSRMVERGARRGRAARRARASPPEVIDPRTLVPLDLERDRPLDASAPAGSSSRTRRCAFGGFGAEIAAAVGAAAFDYLDAPIERVGAPFAPIPLSPPLEDAYLPGGGRDRAAARATLGRGGAEALSGPSAPRRRSASSPRRSRASPSGRA